jgi:hypothetical protein
MLLKKWALEKVELEQPVGHRVVHGDLSRGVVRGHILGGGITAQRNV